MILMGNIMSKLKQKMQTLLSSIERLSDRLDISLKSHLHFAQDFFSLEYPHLFKTPDIWIN